MVENVEKWESWERWEKRETRVFEWRTGHALPLQKVQYSAEGEPCRMCS